MKRPSILAFIAALALVLLPALLLFPLLTPTHSLQAEQDIGLTTIGTFGNVPSTMTASSTSNVNSGVILVRQHRGIAIVPAFTGSGASTLNVTFKWDVSADGTNYTTTQPLSLVVPANGTNAVIAYTNVPATYLNNVRYLRVSSVANGATNSLTGVSITYSYANDLAQ